MITREEFKVLIDEIRDDAIAEYHPEMVESHTTLLLPMPYTGVRWRLHLVRRIANLSEDAIVVSAKKRQVRRN